ncbi:MAG: diguanylate cyclase [Leptospirales bacterium]|nr:diguanylate cyclase [Leptospirales bacterium]
MDNANKNSILIVDDDESDIVILTSILSPEYAVFAVKNGRDAVEIGEEHIPDIILLDVIMPEMNGYDVIAALKNSHKTRNVPVIFITGLDSSEDEEKGLALGAADYISKPFSPSIVSLRVRNQIQMLNMVRTIEKLTVTDQLTGISNRRGFDNRIDLEWRRAMREDTPISILLLDIDKFKEYNDTYGHQQGDVLLQTLAKIIAKSLRRSIDFVARWGGEEFVVLLQNTGLSGALILAERIRTNVENTVILCEDGTKTKVTVSIGVNTQVPERGSLCDNFIAKADKALYEAKKTGRNKVCEPD